MTPTIRPAQTCIECGVSINDRNRGYVNRCSQCSKPKATEEQLNKWEAGNRFYVDDEGERVYYNVVRTFSVNVSL